MQRCPKVGFPATIMHFKSPIEQHRSSSWPSDPPVCTHWSDTSPGPIPVLLPPSLPPHGAPLPPAPLSGPLYPIRRCFLQSNPLWQPHTCSMPRFSGASACCPAAGGQEWAGGRDSPPACDWWYGSVSQPICHICPCHFGSARRRSALAATATDRHYCYVRWPLPFGEASCPSCLSRCAPRSAVPPRPQDPDEADQQGRAMWNNGGIVLCELRFRDAKIFPIRYFFFQMCAILLCSASRI